MNVPLGRPPPALGSARKVTEVKCEENMQARTGGKTRDGHHVISLGCGERKTLCLLNKVLLTRAVSANQKALRCFMSASCFVCLQGSPYTASRNVKDS